MVHFQFDLCARAIKVPYPAPTVRAVDMATAKLSVLMGNSGLLCG